MTCPANAHLAGHFSPYEHAMRYSMSIGGMVSWTNPRYWNS
jgi:hypothetical protein